MDRPVWDFRDTWPNPFLCGYGLLERTPEFFFSCLPTVHKMRSMTPALHITEETSSCRQSADLSHPPPLFLLELFPSLTELGG